MTTGGMATPVPSITAGVGARSIRLILNLTGANDERLREAVKELREQGHTVDVRVAWDGADAIHFAREAAEAGYDVVAAGGGDGTVNAVVGGLLSECRPQAPATCRTSLGILPFGTANDFATACGLDADDLGPVLDLLTDGVPESDRRRTDERHAVPERRQRRLRGGGDDRDRHGHEETARRRRLLADGDRQSRPDRTPPDPPDGDGAGRRLPLGRPGLRGRRLQRPSGRRRAETRSEGPARRRACSTWRSFRRFLGRSSWRSTPIFNGSRPRTPRSTFSTARPRR